MNRNVETNTLSPPSYFRGRRRQPQRPQPVPSRRALFPVRLFWRIRQFVRGITAHVDADEMLVVAHLLPKAALARFCALPLDAQRHSLNVLYTLYEAGWDDPDLAAAALLHDVGKVAGDAAGVVLSPWLRSALVLLDVLAPNKMADLGADDPTQGWRYLLYVHREHPAMGASWAMQDGCSALSCWLIAHHQDKLDWKKVDWSKSDRRTAHSQEQLLALLQWADSQN